MDLYTRVLAEVNRFETVYARVLRETRDASQRYRKISGLMDELIVLEGDPASDEGDEEQKDWERRARRVLALTRRIR